MSLEELVSDRPRLLNSVEKFLEIYERRPVRDNRGGMAVNHSFAVWALAQAIRPTDIIESGVWHGHSTYMLENACPDARIWCLDPRPAKRRYTCNSARYFVEDFSVLDWSHLDTEHTLCFFDDHQNALARLQQMRWWGFRSAIFEDNYPPGKGDFYTLRHVHSLHVRGDMRTFVPGEGNWRFRVRKKFEEFALGDRYPPDTPPVSVAEAALAGLKKNVTTYVEFPPLYLDGRPEFEIGTPLPLMKDLRSSLGVRLLRAAGENLATGFAYNYISAIELRS